jgi:hypothetical protein
MRRWGWTMPCRLGLTVLLCALAPFGGCDDLVVAQGACDAALPLRSDIDVALDAGLAFLAAHQRPSGEFPTRACVDPLMTTCSDVSSSFFTTYIVDGLGHVPDARVDAMTPRALDFLSADEWSGGFWTYFSHWDWRRIDPDIEMVSCVSYTLRDWGRAHEDNVDAVLANRDAAGRFFTWIHASPGAPNDVDCVVNAQAVRYLGARPETATVCAWLDEVLATHGEATCSLYYLNPLTFYFVLSRVVALGIPCLSAPEEIGARVRARQREDGSFGPDVFTALAALTLHNLGEPGPELDLAISHLLAMQRRDGSWANGVFFSQPVPPQTYTGSEEMTTALALQALHTHRDARE